MTKQIIMQYIANKEQKELIKKASAEVGLSVSAFGRSCAIKEAKKILKSGDKYDRG